MSSRGDDWIRTMDSGELKKAVALKYEPAKDGAPKVAAKGAGLVAERIIEVARREGIPIQEDPDLVGALIQLDLQEQIPPELYKVVAEILAFTYRLNRRMMKKG
jgi:flagellar biosynthesis protein